MNMEEQLAKYYQETNKSLIEQRRVIDFDMRNILAELQKDYSIEGKLKVLVYKSEIQQAEEAYDGRVAELKDIEDDLRPVLEAINAHRNAPFIIKVGERSYFDAYISEDGEVITTDNYTKIS